MNSMNIIYHYYPSFRRPIFEALRDDDVEVQFIYGRNSRFGVSSLNFESDEVRHNIFMGGFIFQTFTFGTIRKVCASDSVILGDVRFINAWLYAFISKLSGRRVYFWTHGVLMPEHGLKWLIRKLFYSMANGLLVYSERERALLIDLGYMKKISVIGNSNYSLDDLDAFQLAEESDANCKGICYIGRISAQKGLPDFCSIAKMRPDIDIKLVGPLIDNESYVHKLPSNISLEAPAYDIDQLYRMTRGYGFHVMFTPAGLSIFTAIVLGKRVLVKSGGIQKPEYNILNEYGLVQSFSTIKELFREIDNPTISESEYRKSRLLFLADNSGRKVARRVFAALYEAKG